jgi:hypothetical protein
MGEGQEQKVSIPNFEELVIQGMLEFIYTGTTTGIITPENADEWFHISAMYKLEGLKSVTEVACRMSNRGECDRSVRRRQSLHGSQSQGKGYRIHQTVSPESRSGY